MIHNSVISCDEITNTIKTVPTNFNKEKETHKTKNLYFLLTFLLITIALMIAVSIYCYLVKHQAKQKQLLRITPKIAN